MGRLFLNFSSCPWWSHILSILWFVWTLLFFAVAFSNLPFRFLSRFDNGVSLFLLLWLHFCFIFLFYFPLRKTSLFYYLMDELTHSLTRLEREYENCDNEIPVKEMTRGIPQCIISTMLLDDSLVLKLEKVQFFLNLQLFGGHPWAEDRCMSPTIPLLEKINWSFFQNFQSILSLGL